MELLELIAQWVAVLVGALALFRLWQRRQRERQENPPVEYAVVTQVASEPWRWGISEVAQACGVDDQPTSSTVALKPQWRIEHWVCLLLWILLVGICLWISIAVLRGNSEIVLGIGIIAFLTLFLPTLWGFEPQILAISRTPKGVVVEVGYLVFLRRRFEFLRGSRWKIEGNPQSIWTTSLYQENLNWVVTVRWPSWFWRRRYRWMMTVNDRVGSWLVGGMQDAIR